jgi:uncharacterized protein DUF4054
MAEHTFDVAAFRAQFPYFADVTKYPDVLLSGYFSMAGCYLSPWDRCDFYGDCLQLALNLMTAHLAFLYTPRGNIIPGVGLVTSSTIDRVSVTKQLPTSSSAWQYWLSSTPYGLQLWALLHSKAAGGWMVGGSLERRAFRKAGGIF